MISKKQLDYRLSEIEAKLMFIEEDIFKLKSKKGAKKNERKLQK